MSRYIATRAIRGASALVTEAELMLQKALREKGYFETARVKGLMDKCRRQEGRLLSERENMALVGILSTQLLDEMFIRNFPASPIKEPEEIQIYRE